MLMRARAIGSKQAVLAFLSNEVFGASASSGCMQDDIGNDGKLLLLI